MTMRLFLLNPTTVFAARVNQASFTYPLAEVTFDGVTTGAYGDIEAGMTVLFGSSTGADDYGRQRVRKAATADTLYIGRSSQGTHDGEVDLVDDAYITVLNDYRVWAKVPYIDDDGNIYKDHDLEVSTRTTTPPPVANAGVGVAGTIDSVSGKLRVALPHESNSSFAVTGTLSTYAWDLPTGVTLVGGYALSDSQIVVDCDPGFYWVALTVTDSNGNTHTARVPIFARDPASDATISAFMIERHRVTPQGQELSLRVREDIDADDYPDGTLVMLWEDEPSGPTDRSHMVFTGWLHEEPGQIQAQRSGTLRDVLLECRDVAGKLDSLPGFPQSVEGKGSPSTWTEMYAPNMDKYLHYLLHWHSTALEVADWTWSGTGPDYPFVILGSDGESLFDQVDRRAKALVPDRRLTCNRLGQMMVPVDPLLQDPTDRTATVQTSLLEDDWAEVDYRQQRTPRVHWLRGSAIVAHASTISAVFCIAPGQAPGQGEVEQQSGEQLARSQADLNNCEGNRYARLNAPQSLFTIALAEGDDLGIEPANMTWVNLTMSAAAAQRGLTLSAARGLPRELEITYDQRRGGLVKSVRLIWERETAGDADAVTEPPPVEYEPPEFELPIIPPLPLPDPELVLLPINKVYVATLQGGVYYTANFDDAIPVWSPMNGGLASLNTRDIQLDPANPDYRQYVRTSDGALYRRQGGDWAEILSVTESRVLAGGTDHGRGKVFSIAVDQVTGYLHAFFGPGAYSGGGQSTKVRTYMLTSTDHGENWASVYLPSGGYEYWQRSAGNAKAHDGVVIARDMKYIGVHSLYVSTDSGVTFTTHGWSGGSTIFAVNAFLNWSDTSEAYDNFLSAFIIVLRRIVVATGGATGLFPGEEKGPYHHYAMWFDSEDPDKQALYRNRKFWRTTDRWATLVDAAQANSDINALRSICPQSSWGEWILGKTTNGIGCVRTSADGVTTVNKSGANNTSSPYTDSIPDTCGGVHTIQAVLEWA